MKEQFQQYEVLAGNFWESLPMLGVSGYDAIELAKERKWQPIALWGSHGWDLGNWPLTIVFFRERASFFEVASYCEGDVTLWVCPTEEVRNAITDEIAFFYWQWYEETWVEGYSDVDELPGWLKGPYSESRHDENEESV